MTASKTYRRAPGPHWTRSADMLVRATSNTITRPANVTAYTAGDIINDNATAGGGSSADFELSVPDTGKVERIEVKSSATTTRATLRVWLYSAAPTIGAGDNQAFVASVDTLIGRAELECDIVGSDKTIGFVDVTIPYEISSGGTLYALLETVDGFTPASGETFDIAAMIMPRA